MNLSIIERVEVALEKGDKKGACLLLPSLKETDSFGFSRLCLRYDFHEYSDFWRCASLPVLIGLADVPDYFQVLRRAYLKQKRGRSKFLPALTIRMLQKDPAGTLETIRTTKAFLNDRFWREFPQEAEICKRSDLAGVIETFEAVRDLYKQPISELRKQNASRLASLDLNLFLFLCLASIYYEKELFRQHAIPNEHLPLRLPMIQESINQISLRFEKDGKNGGISDIGSGTKSYLETLIRVSKDLEYWKRFEDFMLHETLVIAMQQALDYYCTYGGEIGLIDGEIHQAVPFEFLSQLEKVRLRSSMEERKIPTTYDHLAKVIAWRKAGSESNSSKTSSASSIYQWEFSGFPKEIKVGGKAINPHFLLNFYKKLENNTKSPLNLYRYKFYRFLEQNPKLEQLHFVGKLAAYIGLQAKQTGVVVTPLSMLPYAELLQEINGKTEDAAKVAVQTDSLQLLVRNNSPKMQSIDIYDQPFFQFGDLLCFFDFTVPKDGFSGNLQNLITKSWQQNSEGDAINQRSRDFEKIIEKSLKLAGFKTIHSANLKLGGKRFSEVDVLAFKGDEILLVEAKSTYYRYNLCRSYEHRERLHEAGLQLDRALSWMHQNKQQFLEEFCIPNGLNNPAIHTLIVTTSQEGNGETWGAGNHLKASIFDLVQLLSNVKVITKSFLSLVLEEVAGSEELIKKIMENTLKMESFQNIKRVGQYLERLEQRMHEEFLPALNIWNEKEEVTPSYILDALRNKVVWGDWDPEQEILKYANSTFVLPSEEDLQIGKVLEEDADAQTLAGNHQEAANIYVQAMKKGNSNVLMKWIEAQEKLEQTRLRLSSSPTQIFSEASDFPNRDSTITEG